MISISPYKNIYKIPKKKSEIVSQILYGENIRIIKRKKNWLKIKTEYDGYIGYVIDKKFIRKFKTSKKVCKLKSAIYNFSNGKFILKKKNYLPFASRIKIYEKRNRYLRFDKKNWILKSSVKNITSKKKFDDIFKMFLNCKYKWGGKNYLGIDCSALIQLYYFYNNKFFPRDTVKQINFKKGIKVKKYFNKGDIIFWKGHVAACLNNKKLIHAYGPRKKVTIMPIHKTIEIIEKTAKLKVKKIIKI